LYCQTWFTREEITTIDEVDESNSFGFKSPVGDGWSMRKSTIKSGQAAHIWTRKPFNGAYTEEWELQDEVLNDGTNSEYDFNWNKYRETKLKYDDSQNSFELISTIQLRNFMEFLIQNSDVSLAGINLHHCCCLGFLCDRIAIWNRK